MSSPPQSSFGDMLLCPVCFEMFEGRIFQCSQGHSVCERCKGHLNNECPQCRGPFVGTRNYVLEEMVKQLKQLKLSVIKTKSDTEIDADGANADASSAADAEIIDTNKLKSELEKLVLSIPKPSPHKPEERIVSAVGANAETATSDSDWEDAGVVVVLGNVIDPMPALRGPVQPKGVFECRMLNCKESLPVCRMLNHILSFHAKYLTENRLPENEDEFVNRYTFKCNDFRQAIRIAQYGIFFLIVNVRKEQNNTKITAWVQCVGRSTECKRFVFNLQMRIGNNIAHYHDYTYGTTSGANYIELKKQCLVYETTQPANRIKEITVDVKISGATGERVGRRRNTTTIMPITN